MTKVMITGAGGAAAVSFMKALADSQVEFYAADMDAYAAGLYWVPAANRILVPKAGALGYVDAVLASCVSNRIDVLVPTVDAELALLADRAEDFAAVGVRLMLASKFTLQCLDKWQLLSMCANVVALPRTELLTASFSSDTWSFPLVVKPRRGSGSRGVILVHTREQLDSIPRSEESLVQEFLPGTEYSVDVLADAAGAVVAAVPRERMKVDSGIAVASRTVHDAELVQAGKAVACAIELRFVGNVQFRRRADGTPVLLEVNPRFPGTMPLTVEAGVNMPLLSLKAVLGEPISTENGLFREVAVVRFWNEKFVEVAEVEHQKSRMVESSQDPREASDPPLVVEQLAS